MSDFTVRADAINVEQIMEQIRARIREKRGVDYTEQQIQDMAAVKLEKFLDPRGVRSDLLDQFRRARPAYAPPDLPNYAFEEGTLFESHRGPLRAVRRLLRPLLKMFFNPNPLIQALNIQSRLNASYAEREAKRDAERHAFDQLYYEVVHNLVTETTRLGIEVKNLKMRVESLTSRLEFDERRSRALESVVAYREPAETQKEEHATAAAAGSPAAAARDVSPGENARPAGPSAPEGPGQRSRRRRRRRGRRGAGSAATMMGASQVPAAPGAGTVAHGETTAADSVEPEPDTAGSGAGDSEPSDQEQ
jgi:hypothetical protein